MSTEKLKYPIEVFWSEEDEGYIALVPDLAGCSAWGASEEEALREIQNATRAWLKVAKKMNRPIPKPSIDKNLSGKFLIRMPKRLHADLVRNANVEGVSLNQYLLYLISQRNAEQNLNSARSSFT